jgi:AbrB family looped-hinge helix DNA binding protein
MKISTKGQVTIPQIFRDRLGLAEGSEIEFIEEDGELLLRKVSNSKRGEDLVRRMTGQGSVKMSTDEIMNLTRG